MSRYDRMSAHDAGYLTRETAVQPLHYVLQLDVEGRLTLADVREHVRGRLGDVPQLQRRTRYPLLAGRPVWVDDPHFDVERQVVAWPTPVQDTDDVDRAFADLTLQRLPRDRPLWRLTVAPGPGETTTLWLSVHHAMMDGSLLNAVLAGLFPAERRSPVPAFRPRRGPSRLELLVLVVLRRLQRLKAKPAVAAAGPPVAQDVPPVLTGMVGAARSLGAASFPLAELQAARKRTGVTINDLILAAVAEALRDWLPDVPPQVLALVPRDVRTEAESQQMGNRAWSILVPLLTGSADPDERLAAIVAATAKGKQAETTSGTRGWSFDVAVSNVRLGGPHSLSGHRMIRHRAAVPLQGSNRLAVVAMSFVEDMTISVTSDGEALPGAQRLAELVTAALASVTAST